MYNSTHRLTEQAFFVIDTNVNGEIDALELKTFYADYQVPITDDIFNHIWQAVDPTGKGYFTMDDLCARLYSIPSKYKNYDPERILG